jgi:hypothetical protein
MLDFDFVAMAVFLLMPVIKAAASVGEFKVASDSFAFPFTECFLPLLDCPDDVLDAGDEI